MLRNGVYGLMDDNDDAAKVFEESNIDQILQKNARVVKLDATTSFSVFKSAFSAATADRKIDVEDPEFWQKVLPDNTTPARLLARLRRREEPAATPASAAASRRSARRQSASAARNQRAASRSRRRGGSDDDDDDDDGGDGGAEGGAAVKEDKDGSSEESDDSEADLAREAADKRKHALEGDKSAAAAWCTNVSNRVNAALDEREKGREIPTRDRRALTRALQQAKELKAVFSEEQRTRLAKLHGLITGTVTRKRRCRQQRLDRFEVIHHHPRVG